MRVETSVSVPRVSIGNREVRDRLIADARTRLVEMGVASEAALTEEPAMMVSDADGASLRVNVTFTWEA